MNGDFGLCPSHPRAVTVPRTVDEALARAARFLQGGRLPGLRHYHIPSGTLSPTPPRIPSLAPTTSLLGPFLNGGGGQFGARLPPWLLPLAAATGPASLRPSPLGLILPLWTPAPPLSRASESRLSSRTLAGLVG